MLNLLEPQSLGDALAASYSPSGFFTSPQYWGGILFQQIFQAKFLSSREDAVYDTSPICLEHPSPEGGAGTSSEQGWNSSQVVTDTGGAKVLLCALT